MSVATEVGVPVRALKRRGQLHRDAAAGAGDKPEEPIDAAKFRAPEARLREVERENDFLRKISVVLRQRTTVEDLYRLVQAKDGQFLIQWMWRRLGDADRMRASLKASVLKMARTAGSSSPTRSPKNEFCHHHSFTTRQSARHCVMRYLEVSYNRWRPHSNNAMPGYRQPPRWPASRPVAADFRQLTKP